MKANIDNARYNINGKHRIEKPCMFYEVHAFDPDYGYFTYGNDSSEHLEPRRSAVLRIYSRAGKSSWTSYACLWVSGLCNGSAKYSGMGLHVPSEAAGLAIASAGIKLDQDVCGRGYEAIVNALTAILKAMGAERVVTTTHTH